MPADTVGQGGLGSLHAYLLTSASLSSLWRRRTLPFDPSVLRHRWHSVCINTPASLRLLELSVVISVSCGCSPYPQCLAQCSLSWPSATAGPRQEGCRLGTGPLQTTHGAVVHSEQWGRASHCAEDYTD
ncbi:unnamed protein product [Pleuronectes platessa]|uniref:Uncharacterized protein n=1 Tax=Pleuronectes platessa TaxID=8262 RepID=A0A9N7Z539_PLEPL|nr:unnamed protein product [Pleuronectes platessa]